MERAHKPVKEISGCSGCPMQRLFPENLFVPPQVGKSLKLAVGEAPGEEEAIVGKPFVGGAGRWLDSILRKARIPRDELTILNLIQCRPPDNAFPTDPEARRYISSEDAQHSVKHCVREHVLPVLESRPWQVVYLFGEKPLRWVGGKTDGIHRWRGCPIQVETEDVRRRVTE